VSFFIRLDTSCFSGLLLPECMGVCRFFGSHTDPAKNRSGPGVTGNGVEEQHGGKKDLDSP